MEEYKVGDEITLEVVEAKYSDDRVRKCAECFFFGLYPNTGCAAPSCMPEEREDGKNVLYIKKGK